MKKGNKRCDGGRAKRIQKCHTVWHKFIELSHKIKLKRKELSDKNRNHMWFVISKISWRGNECVFARNQSPTSYFSLLVPLFMSSVFRLIAPLSMKSLNVSKETGILPLFHLSSTWIGSELWRWCDEVRVSIEQSIRSLLANINNFQAFLCRNKNFSKIL